MFKIFGKHYGTERFFILMFVFLFGMVAIFGYSLSIQHERNSFKVGSTSLYSTWYMWSRTSADGNVVKFVSDSHNTSAFLLLKNNDVSMTSTNADDYQVFLTGTDSPLVNSPSMTVYTFGLSGYVGFYFKDARGFANQRYTLTVRADSAGSIMADESMWDTSVRDQSFRDHNQIRLVVNFGASGIERLPVMDEPGLTPMKIMCDLNLDMSDMGVSGNAGDVPSIQSRAQSTLEGMRKSLVSIVQYRATLEENGVVVPDLPYYIADDKVDTSPNNFDIEPMVFELSMLASGGSGSSGTRFTGTGSLVTGSGTQVEQGGTSSGTGAKWTDGSGIEHEYFYLHTDYLYPGTGQLEWQGVNLSDGFITQTKFYTGDSQPLDDAYASYVKWCKDCIDDYESEMPRSVKYQSWRMTDGSYVDMSGAADGMTQQIQGMINRYVSEVNNYMNLKWTYLNYINNMLETEASVQSLRKVIYSNNGSKQQNLWLY